MAKTLGLCALVGLSVGLAYMYMVAGQCPAWCADMHAGILSGSVEAPFRYRVMGAWVAEVFTGGVAIQYALAHLVIAPLAFMAVGAWLREFGDERHAVIGCMVLASVFLTAYRVWGIALYSLIEVGLLAAGLLYMRRRGADVGYVLLVLVAGINRETTAVLLVLVAAGSGRAWVPSALAMAAVFVGLRLALGDGTVGQSILSVWAQNLVPSRMLAAVFNHLALVPFAVLAWMGRSAVDARLAAVVCVPYVIIVMVFGFYDETRLWLPLLVLWLPAMIMRRGEP